MSDPIREFLTYEEKPGDFEGFIEESGGNLYGEAVMGVRKRSVAE